MLNEAHKLSGKEQGPLPRSRKNCVLSSTQVDRVVRASDTQPTTAESIAQEATMIQMFASVVTQPVTTMVTADDCAASTGEQQSAVSREISQTMEGLAH